MSAGRSAPGGGLVGRLRTGGGRVTGRDGGGVGGAGSGTGDGWTARGACRGALLADEYGAADSSIGGGGSCRPLPMSFECRPIVDSSSSVQGLLLGRSGQVG